MKSEKKKKDIFWSVVSIVVGGIVWLTMPGVSWGVIDPAKVGLVFAVIGLITLVWAIFSSYDDGKSGQKSRKTTTTLD